MYLRDATINTSEFYCFKDCSDFKAGDILRSNSQYRALDETAVFGSACRHGFPKQFINLKHGERYIIYRVYKKVDSFKFKLSIPETHCCDCVKT